MKLIIILIVAFATVTYSHVANTQDTKTPDLVRSREITANVIKLFDAGMYDEALPLAKEALELREKALGSQHPELIPLLINLAEIEIPLKKFEASESFFDRALEIAESAYGHEDIKISTILDKLAYVESELGKDATLEKVLLRSLAIKEKALSNDVRIAQTAYDLAHLYKTRREYQKAAPLYQRAVQIREQVAEKDHFNLVQALEGYFYVLTALKRKDEAARVQHRLAQLSAENAVIQEGGVLNGKALVLPAPSYPMSASAEHASGRVQVQVLIDENGNVISAKALNPRKSHPALVHAAEKAALKARFTPTFAFGKPVKVNGIIIYDFVRQ